MNFPLITRELVLQLEAAEAAYHEAKLCALAAQQGNARGVEITRIGGCRLLSIQRMRHNPSYNRAMCFATEEAAHLDDVVRWLRERAAHFWFDVAPALIDDEMLGRLAAAGLCPSFLLNVVYTVPRKVDDPAPEGVTIEEIQVEECAHHLAVALVEGFGIPREALPGTERQVRAEYAAPGWHVFLASADGRPAAMATLYVEGEIASIDGMATVPAYRNRGYQSTLLRRCTSAAALAGCRLLASQAQPSSTSERNMVRAGFRIAYTKMLYADRKDAESP